VPSLQGGIQSVNFGSRRVTTAGFDGYVLAVGKSDMLCVSFWPGSRSVYWSCPTLGQEQQLLHIYAHRWFVEAPAISGTGSGRTLALVPHAQVEWGGSGVWPAHDTGITILDCNHVLAKPSAEFRRWAMPATLYTWQRVLPLIKGGSDMPFLKTGIRLSSSTSAREEEPHFQLFGAAQPRRA
jgi:hypothetical protein